MRNLLLTLRYNGTAFHGWQIQPNGNTIQQELCNAFKNLSGNDENIIGCSRTDAGVHANMFCCNVRTECNVPTEKIPDALNFYLPPEIAVYNCKEVDYDFHARYDCKGKEYVYLIHNGKHRNPFYENNGRGFSLIFYEFFNDFSDSTLIMILFGDIIGCFLYERSSICHGDSCGGSLKHGQVIFCISGSVGMT